MGEIQRINCYFNMDNPLHKEAWDYLKDIPTRQRMDAVITAVLRLRDEKRYLAAIREALKIAPPEAPPPMRQGGNVSDAALDFLISLEEGGDFFE